MLKELHQAIHAVSKPARAQVEENPPFAVHTHSYTRTYKTAAFRQLWWLWLRDSFWFVGGFTLATAPCCEDALPGERHVRKRTEDSPGLCLLYRLSCSLFFLPFFLQCSSTKTTQACSPSSSPSVTQWHGSRFHSLSSGLRAVGDLAYHRRNDIQAWQHELRMESKIQLLIS